MLYNPRWQVVADLRAAKALISDPKKWSCAGATVRDPATQEVLARCSLIAILDVADTSERRNDAIRALSMAIGNNSWIAKWNDDPSRTHAEVMAAFDRAIELS